MTESPATTAPVSRHTRPAAAIALTLAFVAFLVWGPIPVPVTIDGRASWVLRGTTAAALFRQGRLAGVPGGLVSMQGRVLVAFGGGPPVIRVNGRESRIGVGLGAGSQIVSSAGPDVVEDALTRVIATPPPRRVRGTGPVESVEESGTPGTAEVVVGAVSGDELSRRVISEGAPATVRREPAWAGAKEVALTFDDGPWPVSTDAILSQLRAAGIRATFFMVGYSVNRRPELARRVRWAGMEIGNHTQSHKLLRRATPAVINSQIRRGRNTILRVTGARTVWYRPAGGSRSAAVYREAKKLHQRVVMWTVDPKDWSRPGSLVIARRVLDHVQPGSVILMHDGGGDRSQTVEALKLVIHGLKARGYAMVTLSRLRHLPEAPLPPRPFRLPESMLAL